MRKIKGDDVARVLIKEVEIDLPLLRVQCLPFAPISSSLSAITVLIGRNGSGKSSLLRDLVVSLRGYFFGHTTTSYRRKSKTRRVEIESDAVLDIIGDIGSRGGLHSVADPFQFRGDGPSKIIALSFTPFDKFPAGDNLRLGENNPEAARDRYIYLGFRGAMRASPRALLLQSIDQLALSASSPREDRRVVDVLAIIGYRPILEINYGLNRLDKVLKSTHIDRAHIERLVESISPLLAPSLGKRAAELKYRFDFSRGAAANFDSNQVEYDTLRELVRANALRMTSATLERESGGDVELLDMSSGELSLLCGFLGLAAHLEEGCIVLIDEPENSLHPEWQLRYVEMLGAVMDSRPGCHYVLATHSPLIVSGFAGRGCAVLRLDEEPVVVEEAAVANSSPDAALLSAFNVVTPDNSFIKQLVLEGLSLIEQGRQDDERANLIARFLLKFEADMPEGSKLHSLVRNFCTAILQK